MQLYLVYCMIEKLIWYNCFLIYITKNILLLFILDNTEINVLFDIKL